MAHPILMPKPGQMTEDCTLLVWHVSEGQAVHPGDVLFEIETDKANMDVEAFDEGVLLKQCVAAGQTVPVSTVCGYVGAIGEAIPDSPGVPALPAPLRLEAPGASDSVAVAQPVAVTQPVAVAVAQPVVARLPISPRASRMAAEHGLDPRSVTGTGPGGRITERDVRGALDGKASPAPTPAAAAVVSAATGPAAASVPSVPRIAETPEAPGFIDDESGPQPMTRMRRVIAERLTRSWTSSPHFTVTVAVDVTDLLALRRELKAAGSGATLTDFVLAATAQALVEFPDVNARTDGVSVWRRQRVHLGIAVSLAAGLVVPVLRDADWWTVSELHDRAAALVEAAREGTLSPDDMTGGTFTVSNMGMYQVEEFSAIINPGEAAILAVSSAIETPVAVNGAIAVRSIMKLTLSADHRLVDGAMGARFLNAVRRRLEDAAGLRAWARNA